MFASTHSRDDRLVVRFSLDADDRAVSRRVEFTGTEMVTQLAAEHDVDDIHPDLMALSILLCVQPWARTLTLDHGVSKAFATAVRDNLRIKVRPVDRALRPRRRPVGGRPGLAYSGGADCTAALTVMPPSTASYFLDRVTPPDREWSGVYRKDAARYACAELDRRGRQVRTLESDLEFLRSPKGFPHDLANAVPAVLHADLDVLDSIGWGAILESTYRIGSPVFRDYTESTFVAGFGPVFAAVGLPIFNPVAGVSEVGTAMITSNSPYGEFSQSCMRGTVGEPCRRCWKCARKILLDSALSGDWPDRAEISRMFTRHGTPVFLRKEPLKHEGVVAFIADRYPRRIARKDLMRLLATRVSGYDVDWLARWYVPSLDVVPDDYRDPTASRLDDYMARMTADDAARLTGWDLTPLVESPRRRKATARFLSALDDDIAAHEKRRRAGR